MKKIIVLMSLVLFSFSVYAGKKNTKEEKPQVVVQNVSSIAVMEVCAFASTTYQGVTIICYRCAATMGGPNGAEAKAADCLMDAMMEIQP